jgi:hypothetical protein
METWIDILRSELKNGCSSLLLLQTKWSAIPGGAVKK